LKNRRVAEERDAQQNSRQTHIRLLVMIKKMPINELTHEKNGHFSSPLSCCSQTQSHHQHLSIPAAEATTVTALDEHLLYSNNGCRMEGGVRSSVFLNQLHFSQQ